MRVSFVETMRGELRDEQGQVHPVEFELRTDAGWSAFLRDGRTEATGLVRAAPWASEAPIRGTLTIDPRAPRIAYALQFEGGDETYALSGEKHPDWRHPLTSMTRLPLTLQATGRVLAEGSVRFDLRELPQFLVSWLPLGRAQKALDVRRRQVERRLLDAT